LPAQSGAKVAIGNLNLDHATRLADERVAEGHECSPIELDVPSRPATEAAGEGGAIGPAGCRQAQFVAQAGDCGRNAWSGPMRPMAW
jgi:hypothetical protein